MKTLKPQGAPVAAILEVLLVCEHLSTAGGMSSMSRIDDVLSLFLELRSGPRRTGQLIVERFIAPAADRGASKNVPGSGCRRVGPCFSASIVRAEGLEPPHLAMPEPKSGASASSATPARPAFSPNLPKDATATWLPTPRRPSACPVRRLASSASMRGPTFSETAGRGASSGDLPTEGPVRSYLTERNSRSNTGRTSRFFVEHATMASRKRRSAVGAAPEPFWPSPGCARWCACSESAPRTFGGEARAVWRDPTAGAPHALAAWPPRASRPSPRGLTLAGGSLPRASRSLAP